MRVSIPQGTIKSLDIDAPRSYSFVSIPQGTIKSALENKIENKPFRVSIPQGTIKRSGGRGAARRGGRFQFHKVRLKVVAVPASRTILAPFQFHKVRLKGGRRRPKGDA